MPYIRKVIFKSLSVFADSTVKTIQIPTFTISFLL